MVKYILCSGPLLQYPDYKKGCIVTCNASSTGIGSVLSQGPLGHDLPVAYASRVITKAERNDSIERELQRLFGVASNISRIFGVESSQL